MMHKGWWAVFIVTIIQVLVGFLIHFSAHDADESGESSSDLVVDVTSISLPETGEFAYLPADLLPEAHRPSEDLALCARICAVPASTAALLSGKCSNPLRITGTIEDEGGESWLVAQVSPEASSDYQAFFSALERRLLLLGSSHCGDPSTADPPKSDADQGAEEGA